jgi:pyruvate dehydrogenase E1 component alpha subunit
MAIAVDDFMTGNHRSHGHPIGKGADPNRLMAELFGKATGVCRGNGGSMHLADFSIGSLGETAIVGSSLPIAVGAGLASKLGGWNRVCLAFFGDGASNTGAFHESLNLAAIWKLPVIFLCENNGFAISTRHGDVCSVEQISQRGSAYGIRAETIDGQDPLAVWTSVDRAATDARSGGGPVLIEAMTNRYGDHSYRLRNLGDRTQEEVDVWRRNDPIANLSRQLQAAGIATESELRAVQDGVDLAIDAAVRFARASAYPTAAGLWDNMYVDPSGFSERRHNKAWLAATAASASSTARGGTK